MNVPVEQLHTVPLSLKNMFVLVTAYVAKYLKFWNFEVFVEGNFVYEAKNSIGFINNENKVIVYYVCNLAKAQMSIMLLHGGSVKEVYTLVRLICMQGLVVITGKLYLILVMFVSLTEISG